MYQPLRYYFGRLLTHRALYSHYVRYAQPLYALYNDRTVPRRAVTRVGGEPGPLYTVQPFYALYNHHMVPGCAVTRVGGAPGPRVRPATVLGQSN